MGGKAIGCKFIIDILNDPKYDGMDYLEPFVGYCNILRRVKNKKSYTASDYNPLLITLWNGVRGDLEYPEIDRERYKQLKKTRNNDWETAIACFCHSYNGKIWGGYARQRIDVNGRICDTRRENINYYEKLKQNDVFMNCDISYKSYLDYEPNGMLIYCDPPYQNTTGYGVEFNHDKFWETMRRWSKNNVVYISEYTAPDDFICVGQHVKRTTMNANKMKGTRDRVERLFQLRTD